jgi:formimidoylglutamate deiminase
MSKQTTLWAEQALTANGWANRVTVQLGSSGRIAGVTANAAKPTNAVHCGVLLPAIANVHSHAFQRALAGMTEQRGTKASDSFWTWRELMYRFLKHLGPLEVEAISAYVFMETLCAGYAAIGEFHYLHHQPDGSPYADLAEMSQRLAAAASTTGIGLTLLPVLYQQGGCDARALNKGQMRFFNDPERFARLHDGAANAVAGVSPDCNTGVAPHSLRAVSRQALTDVQLLAPGAPIHLHIAEQTAEVDEVMQAWGQRPVEWLLSNHPVDERWCLVHATQMTNEETSALAASGAVAGLCPITEANLGDGIFKGASYLAANGRFGIGSDSNVQISVANELRLLEYSQRLRDHSRAVLATQDNSTGRLLYESAAIGGAQATGRNAGTIAPGSLADLVALDHESIALTGLQADTLLDSYVFAGSDALVTDVWSAGRHVVKQGRHIRADEITSRYRKTIRHLRSLL